jgi:GT2 family glycosyltransferase
LILLTYVHPTHVTTAFMQSVLKLLTSRSDIGVAGKGSGPLISRARNELVQHFLDTPATHMFSVDTDIVFEPGILEMLLKADKPIVGAHYMGLSDTGNFPVGNVQEHGMWAKATYKSLKGRKGIRPIGAVGMGCTLIKREVLESLGTGALWPFAETLAENGQMLGEDVTFCQRAREAGFDSYIHLDARVGHLKSTLVTP